MIERSFGLKRFAWNQMLDFSQKEKVYNGRTLRDRFAREKVPNYPWVRKLAANIYQNSILDLGETYRQMFESIKGKRKGKRLGSPVFKSKHAPRQSFKVTNENGSQSFGWHNNRIEIPKMNDGRGNHLSAIKSKEFPRWPKARVIQIVISRVADSYYASVIFKFDNDEIPENTRPVQSDGGTVGIDWGVKTFMTLSDGTEISSLDFTKIDKQIKKWQRRVSRKKLGSKNREKAKLKLQRKTAHKAQMIEDQIQKQTTFLVRNYNDIHIEDLRPSNMMKNHSLARKIADKSFYKLKTILQYKVDQLKNEYGIDVNLEIPNPKYTTQKCSSCGHVHSKDHGDKVELGERTFICHQCGFRIGRDLNAAINISQLKTGDTISPDEN